MTIPDTNSLPLPVFIANTKGTITYVNAAWRRVFASGVGDHWLTYFPDVVAADFVDRWRAGFEPDGSACARVGAGR